MVKQEKKLKVEKVIVYGIYIFHYQEEIMKKTLIKITDNGKGIPKDDLPLAIERHATSKLRQIEDLEKIVNMVGVEINDFVIYVKFVLNVILELLIIIKKKKQIN